MAPANRGRRPIGHQSAKVCKVRAESGGVAGAADGKPHAFIYSNGIMVDLNDLIPPGSGLTLAWAYGISDNGFITGYATTADGQAHAFLLMPSSLP